MSSDKRRKARIQGGWAAAPPKPSSDSDKPQVAVPPAWCGKNVDVYNPTSHTVTGDTRDQVAQQFVYQKPEQEIPEEQKVKVIEKAGVYDLSSEPSGISRIRLFPFFIEEHECDWMYDQLFHDLPWKQRSDYPNTDKERLQPRLTAWFGEHSYTYSGHTIAPIKEWNPLLLQLRERLEENTGMRFNSVLANLYRDGHDSVGWHADDEKGLGPEPVIASLSLGDTRNFEMRKVPPKASSWALAVGMLPLRFSLNGNGDARFPSSSNEAGSVGTLQGTENPVYTNHLRIPLDAGTLLVMEGATQNDWQHRIPAEYHDRGPRINLTFRVIYPMP